MEQATFFPGANRRVTIGSPTKQCSNGRIVFGVVMPLTGESFASLPEWVGKGYEAVAGAFNEVNPEVQEVSDLSLAFSNDKPAGELFAPPSARLLGASLKGFRIVRAGDPDDPEVELHFKAYGPFTRDFWAWIGEMAGHEVYMAFPATISGTVAAAPVVDTLLDEEPHFEAERAGSCKPEHDAEFAGSGIDIPDDPTLEEDLGDDFEASVRKSMGVPEPFGEKIRLVDARGRGGKTGASKKRTTLAVN